MSSPLGSKQNIKVFVLYLMENVGHPLDFVTVNEIVMQTDYVAYLDFAESFSEMEDTGLVEKRGMSERGEPAYVVTERGHWVVESLRGGLLPSVLEESRIRALRLLDFRKRGVKASCRVTPARGGGYDFACSLTEGERTLLSVTLWVDSSEQAARLENHFRENPEHVYRASAALLSGDVNYLFG